MTPTADASTHPVTVVDSAPAARPARPPRDDTVDALRAVAVLGVVLGHWMVSALVSDPYLPAALHGESPLSYAPWFAPASWLLQTLGLFFFAGGYAAARSRARSAAGIPPPSAAHLMGRGRRMFRPGPRHRRLVRPLLIFGAVWAPGLWLLAATGAPDSTHHVVMSLVTHPLWFLPVYLALVALTPVIRAAVLRVGVWAVLPALTVVVLTDALRGHGLPLWWKIAVTVVGWSVPYLLGVALAEDRLARRSGATLLILGTAGGALLVLGAGYPASAVGVPGDRWSNLDPPSLFAVCLAFAQLGVFLLVRPRLAEALRHRALRAPITVLNRTAMEVFCWHQTALLLVTFTGLLSGVRLPGLLDPPDGWWPLHRLLWLPLFALVLVALVRVFHHPPAPSNT